VANYVLTEARQTREPILLSIYDFVRDITLVKLKQSPEVYTESCLHSLYQVLRSRF